MWTRAKKIVNRDTEAEHAPLNQPVDTVVDEVKIDDDIDNITDPREKEAIRKWKEDNPKETIKHWRRMHQTGQVEDFPWNHPAYQDQLGLQADNRPEGLMGEVRGFGTAFPPNPNKSDMFLRVDQLPSVLYKFNGKTWIEVDKSQSDTHAYNDAYIDHLIEKISTGEYDLDLLSDAERDSIEQRLRSTGQA
jgi:hypothetical protein